MYSSQGPVTCEGPSKGGWRLEPWVTGLALTLSLPLQHVKSKATIDEIMKDLDINRDAQISFCEVMLLITRVTIATHEHLHDVEGQQQQQQQQLKQQHHH